MVPPRQVPDRDSRYMGLAFWIAGFSKDPRTQVGAILVDGNNRPLGIGYNGPPRRIDDQKIDWDRPHKYPYIVHAERNAIDHSCGDLEGSTLYVTACPCSSCMLDIVTAGIERVVYYEMPVDSGSLCVNNVDRESANDIATKGSVTLNKFAGDLSWMKDRYAFFLEKGLLE